MTNDPGTHNADLPGQQPPRRRAGSSSATHKESASYRSGGATTTRKFNRRLWFWVSVVLAVVIDALCFLSGKSYGATVHDLHVAGTTAVHYAPSHHVFADRH